MLEPAPIAVKRQEDPGRPTQATTEVRNARVDGDDQVETLTQCRRFLKVERRAVVGESCAQLSSCGLVRAHKLAPQAVVVVARRKMLGEER